MYGVTAVHLVVDTLRVRELHIVTEREQQEQQTNGDDMQSHAAGRRAEVIKHFANHVQWKERDEEATASLTAPVTYTAARCLPYSFNNNLLLLL